MKHLKFAWNTFTVVNPLFLAFVIFTNWFYDNFTPIFLFFTCSIAILGCLASSFQSIADFQKMNLTDFIDGQILSRYRKIGWEFRLEEWTNKDDEKQFDLAFKSPRMSAFETSYTGKMGERMLLDEEAWAVAREYMDKNLCFQAEFKEKFLDFFRQNRQVNPESVVSVIEFKMKNNLILQNAVKIIEKGKITYLNSTHRHDFVVYEFENGARYHLDGGKEYIKRGCGNIPDGVKIEDYSLDENSPNIKECLLWGSRGKDGKSPLKYAPFAELELDHLRAILEYKDKFHIPLADIQIEVINYWIEQKAKKEMNKTLQIEQSRLEQLLREIRHAYSEGFRACQFTEAREEELFANSAAAKVIDSYGKEFNIETNKIQ